RCVRAALRSGRRDGFADSTHVLAERRAWRVLPCDRLPARLPDGDEELFAVCEVAVDGSASHAGRPRHFLERRGAHRAGARTTRSIPSGVRTDLASTAALISRRLTSSRVRTGGHGTSWFACMPSSVRATPDTVTV